jgi:hypothetical protein
MRGALGYRAGMGVLNRLALRVGFWSLSLLASWPAGAQEPAPSSVAEGATEAEATAKPAAEPAATEQDGWPDGSSFLDQTYGFLPVVSPITEPAVGYGAAGGLMFLSKSFGDAAAGLGRPNITFVGGMGTASRSWGVFGADVRYWLADHVQTLFAAIYGSLNLDFYGIGKTDALKDHPLHYNLNPRGGLAQAKYRFGETNFWAGLNTRFMSTAVSFDAPQSTPELPDFDRTTNLGGVTALAVFDSRSNVFTPIRGTYAEVNAGAFGAGAGAFGRAELLALQFFPLPFRLYLGLRGQFRTTFGPAPFYFRPYVALRGVAQMRFQGEEVAQLEAELRWQFWKRLSLVGFGGGGGAWTKFERFDSAQGVGAGGGGMRYEVARKYGIHAGVDVAASRDTVAFYIQVGSAWARP